MAELDTDAILARAREEMDQRLAESGPAAVGVLTDRMQNSERDADRIKAASLVIDHVKGRAATQRGEEVDRGPTLNVTINMLTTGEREVRSIPVSETAMDAIEAGRRALEDACESR